MKLSDIYWTAGFYEGEGCCIINNNSPIVSISQKQKWPLEKLQALWKGKIYEGKNKTGGYYIWTISGTHALELIFTIYVLLSPEKKYQIVNSLSYFDWFMLGLSPVKSRFKVGESSDKVRSKRELVKSLRELGLA